MSNPTTKLKRELTKQNKLLDQLKANLEAYQKLMDKWAKKS